MTFIIRQDLPAQEAHKLSDYYKDLIVKFGGSVVKNEYWGLRSLAYEIKKNKKGHYMFFGVKSGHETIRKVQDDFKVREDVLKNLVIKVDSIDDSPSLMMQTPSDNEN